MRTIILIIFTIMCFGTCVAQSPDTILIEATNTTYNVVVEDDMINYPFGKDFPGKITVVYPNGIFLNTDVPNQLRFRDLVALELFDGRRYRPQTANPTETPRLRYFSNGGSPYFVNLNTGTGFIPIDPALPNGRGSFWAQWEWENQGGNTIHFGPVLFAERN